MPKQLAKDSPKHVMRVCRYHGQTQYSLVGHGLGTRRYRCMQCTNAHKSNHRKRVRQILIEEAGGACSRCSYDRCYMALHFHHVDPSTKKFELSKLSRSIDSARQEAQRCILLCANCHTEVTYAPVV